MARSREAELDEAYERRLRALGLALQGLEIHATEEGREGVRVVEYRFKCDADNDTGVLLVQKARVKGAAMVAFVGGVSLTGVVLAAHKKLVAGVTRWREDRPYEK